MRANHERRQLIADAAIRVLADAGAHGLSHRAVDTQATVPRGTTSNFFNTRKELVLAAARRLNDTHWRYVHAMRDQLDSPLDREKLAAILHRLVTAEDEEVRVRHLARYELFLAGVREPELRPILADIRRAAMQTAVLLLESAGLPEPAQHVQLLAAVLNGLTFDHITAPPSEDLEQPSISWVLDAIFGTAPESPSG
jgi:DNA-binding transcriptional regulator YbjK